MVCGGLAARPAHGQTESILYGFTGGSDGYGPLAGVIMDKKGNLFGTTDTGGAYNFGVVYMLAPPYGQNNYAVLYSFTGGADGGYPLFGSLIMDKKGNLYGTTGNGGDTSIWGPGAGVVFKLAPPYGQNSETVLYTFSGGADGAFPYSGVILDKKGNLYGTTEGGGASGYGAVFKLAPPYGQNSETVLYNFHGGSDGGTPTAGVIMDGKGNLYGTTSYGGASESGVVFKLDKKGSETVLYSFTGGADGWDPHAGVVMDKKGNLYGTTQGGGAAQVEFGYGVVFKLSLHHRQYTETVLYTFTGGADGWEPDWGVIIDKKGNLYGTTTLGGEESVGDPQGDGVVFKLDPSGNETVLHTFSRSTNDAGGANPFAGVIMDNNGNLYGTTANGGSNPGAGGVVFEISP